MVNASRRRQGARKHWVRTATCAPKKQHKIASQGALPRAEIIERVRVPRAGGAARSKFQVTPHRYRRRELRSANYRSELPTRWPPGSHEPGCDALLCEPNLHRRSSGISTFGYGQYRNWPTIKQGGDASRGVTDVISVSRSSRHGSAQGTLRYFSPTVCLGLMGVAESSTHPKRYGLRGLRPTRWLSVDARLELRPGLKAAWYRSITPQPIFVGLLHAKG